MTDTQAALDATCICCCRPLSEHRQKDRMCQASSYFIENALQSRTEQEPVAEITKKTHGSYSPNYTLKWFSEVGIGEKLYTSPPDQSARIAELEAALEGFDADFMTSETHHPNHVLIPTEVFDRVRAALHNKLKGQSQ